MIVIDFVCVCGCRCLSAVGGCVFSIRRFGFRRCGVTFNYVWVIQTSKIYTIKDKKLNQWLSAAELESKVL